MADSRDLETFLQSVLRETVEAIKKDLALYLLAGLILIALSFITLGVLLGPLSVGFIQLVRKRRSGEVVYGAGDIFSGMASFGTAFLVTLIAALGVAIGTVLLVVPGLIVGFIVMYAFQEIAYRNAGIGASLSGSYGLVRANVVPSLLVFVIVVAINAVGSAVLFGSFITLPFTLVMLTIAYEKLIGYQGTAAATSSVPA